MPIRITVVSIGRGSSSTVPPEVEALLEALAQALTGEGDEAEGEAEGPQGSEGEPEGREEPQGFDPGDNPFEDN
jgi:hypothetical protein